MTVEDTRARIAARVRQALTASDLAWSTAQRQKLDALAAEIADNVLLEFDAILAAFPQPGPTAAPQQAAAQAPAQPPVGAPAQGNLAPGQEEVLWEGRPFLSIGELYVITSQRIRLISGLVGKGHEDIELVRVQDVDHHQGISERILNIGDIYVRTSDKSSPDVVLRNVTNPEQVHEILRRAMLNARRGYPFIFEQQM